MPQLTCPLLALARCTHPPPPPPPLHQSPPPHFAAPRRRRRRRLQVVEWLDYYNEEMDNLLAPTVARPEDRRSDEFAAAAESLLSDFLSRVSLSSPTSSPG